MKCPECVALDQRSTVTPLGGSTTCMYCPPFYDEDGVYHHHDCNTITESYRCSNGHHWTTHSNAPCPARGCTFGRSASTQPTEGR